MTRLTRRRLLGSTAAVAAALAGCAGPDGDNQTSPDGEMDGTPGGGGLGGTPEDDGLGGTPEDGMETPTEDSMGTPTEDEMETPTEDGMETPTEDGLLTPAENETTEGMAPGAGGETETPVIPENETTTTEDGDLL